METTFASGETTNRRRIARPAVLLVLGLLSACGGVAPNPVSQYQPGDEKRSCDGLTSEIVQNEAEIAELLPDADATGKNVALGVTGAFLLIPWFFMDFKEGEAVDIKALDKRNDWLREVAADKDCQVPPPKIKVQERPSPTDDAPGGI